MSNTLAITFIKFYVHARGLRVYGQALPHDPIGHQNPIPTLTRTRHIWYCTVPLSLAVCKGFYFQRRDINFRE